MTGAADKAAADALFAAGKNTVNEPHVLDCGKYAGMTALEARKAILADLKEGGFLKETEPLKHEVGTCYRCHSTIEPMVSKQWFVKMEPLAKPAIESVEKGEIKFVPERFTKNYMNWMKNTRDWCISRQLWWGHQIPAWYCDDCGETVVAKSAPCTCPKCGGAKLTQDPDTLDTWFSSALWPFSTLGWPNEESADLKYFYPTNTLVTGYDIIGFWVSRMIFSGLAYTGKAPLTRSASTVLCATVRAARCPRALATASTRWKSLPSTAQTLCALCWWTAPPRATICAISKRRWKLPATLPISCGTLPAFADEPARGL